jgi:hypothetical protein|nr:MAG TPA: holin [Caudoviricetes sp.]
MGVNEWIAVLGAIGGTSTITWLVTFWVNRKTNARKEDATVDSMENENERKQVDWLEKRLAERDAKIDAIYVELRQEQAEKLQLIHDKHELELKLKEAEIKKCDVRGCGNRQPPSDY